MRVGSLPGLVVCGLFWVVGGRPAPPCPAPPHAQTLHTPTHVLHADRAGCIKMSKMGKVTSNSERHDRLEDQIEYELWHGPCDGRALGGGSRALLVYVYILQVFRISLTSFPNQPPKPPHLASGSIWSLGFVEWDIEVFSISLAVRSMDACNACIRPAVSSLRPASVLSLRLAESALAWALASASLARASLCTSLTLPPRSSCCLRVSRKSENWCVPSLSPMA